MAKKIKKTQLEYVLNKVAKLKNKSDLTANEIMCLVESIKLYQEELNKKKKEKTSFCKKIVDFLYSPFRK